MKNTTNAPTSEPISSSRRKFVQATAAGLAVLTVPHAASFAFSSSQSQGKAQANTKVVWVLLRGALDSLHTIIPTQSPQYSVLRPKLSKSFKAPLLKLNHEFSLHPSLKNLHAWYQEKAMLPIVAVSSGYDARSHFDGQDFLESGKTAIDHDSGWLARAIDVKQKQALAVSRATPISLRSSNNVNTWYPSRLTQADDDIYQSLSKLYQDDAGLSEHLAKAIELKGLTAMSGDKAKKQRGNFSELSKTCAKLMTGEQGVDCAMLELGGWDTHNNQSFRLEKKLAELDQGLATLKAGLADDWHNTVIIIGTEFGRTAKENGTGGTDHGTASTLLLAGGAVDGGKVLGKWPGLATEQLFEQRDLMPTTRAFSWISTVLNQHWGLSEKDLETVFPNTQRYQETLIKRANLV